MIINRISPISFKATCIKVPLKSKYTTDGRLEPTSMDTVFKIANDDKSPMFIEKDVLILKPSDKIKRELNKNEIEFEEEVI